jgi:hypothetical protein
VYQRATCCFAIVAEGLSPPKADANAHNPAAAIAATTTRAATKASASFDDVLHTPAIA